MRTLPTLAAAMLLTVATLCAHADPITSIVVYGDSLSDNGNVLRQTGFFPPPPYAGGRFSNGPVAVEQLAANLNVSLTDYAYAGATSGTGNILNGETFGPVTLSGLPGIQTTLQSTLGSLPSSLASTLFIVWGGANDFEAITDFSASGITTAATTAAGNIDGIVATLQGAGATNILVPNLPDLSKTPEFSGAAAPAALGYTTVFNGTLAATLPKGATLFDTNAVFNAILSNPGSFGITDTSSYCIAGLAFPSCSGYLFFDDIHPTTAVNGILAADFQAAVAPAATPEPSSLVLLGTGLAGAAGLLRRRKRALQE